MPNPVSRTGGFCRAVGGSQSPGCARCCHGRLHGQLEARSPDCHRGRRDCARALTGARPLRPRSTWHAGLLAREPGLRSQQGVERAERPVQVGPRVRQLPAEPGALRGRGLRAAGGHPQEGAPRGPQVFQGHVQRVHLVDEPGREGRQGRGDFGDFGDFGRRVSAAALWGGRPGLPAVLAASPTAGLPWPSGRVCPVLDLRGTAANTCVGGKTEGVPVSVCCRPRSPGPLLSPDCITPNPLPHSRHAWFCWPLTGSGRNHCRVLGLFPSALPAFGAPHQGPCLSPASRGCWLAIQDRRPHAAPLQRHSPETHLLCPDVLLCGSQARPFLSLGLGMVAPSPALPGVRFPYCACKASQRGFSTACARSPWPPGSAW